MENITNTDNMENTTNAANTDNAANAANNTNIGYESGLDSSIISNFEQKYNEGIAFAANAAKEADTENAESINEAYSTEAGAANNTASSDSGNSSTSGNSGNSGNTASQSDSENVSSMSWGQTGAYSAPVTNSYVSNGSGNAKGTNGMNGTPSSPKRTNSGPAIVFLSIFLSLLVGFGGGLLALSYGPNFIGSSAGTGSTIVKEVTKETGADDVLTTESIADMVADSVVEITTESVQTGSLFGEYISKGAGSGIVISKDGYIATNNHVIDGANEVKVRLRNGTEYEAKLVGTDEQTDIALLKVEAKDLTPATFGDSDKLSVGEKAVVIGNPLGQLGGTVTCGIISALDREVTIENQKRNLLQTDASINPGNSGGALFDGHGNVVGMVEAKSSGQDVEGIGFAIPSNEVKNIINELKENGHVTGRPYLGISMVDISTMQEAFQYNVNHAGTYIAQVVDNSAAEKAGLKIGDCITKIDGAEVRDSAEIKEKIQEKKVGDRIKITVLRAGETEEEEKEIEATIGEQNDTASSAIKKYENSSSSSDAKTN